MLVEKILELKETLLDEYTIATKMVTNSLRGLFERNARLLTDVIETYEPKVNRREIEIDEMSIAIIARYHPEAKDLRTIIMMLKMNNDMERVGDSAVNIAESARYLIERASFPFPETIRTMASETEIMTQESLIAFLDEDVARAEAVCIHDDIVDNLLKETTSSLMDEMAENTAAIECSFHLLRIAHNIERIADLATNVSENTIFIQTGRIIKHHNESPRNAERITTV